MNDSFDTALLPADAGAIESIENLESAEGRFYPLSIGQKALWVLHQMSPHSSAYNVAAAFAIHQDFDTTLFHRALQAVAHRHEALRTHIRVREGQPWQVVHPVSPLAFMVATVNNLSAPLLQERMRSVAQVPFDLELDPLLRCYVYVRPAHAAILQLVAHHIIFDMASLDIVLKEVGALYDAYRTGQEATLPAVALQYHDFSERQEAMLAGPTGATHADYWMETLRGPLPVLELPTDYPRPPVQTYRGGLVQFALGAELTEGIAALSRAQGVGRYMTLLAAYGALLSRYSGQSELLIGFPTAGRSDPALTEVVGYLVNPVVLRLRCEPDMDTAQLLSHVRQTVVEALEHRDYPFPALVESLRLQRDAGHTPVFQNLFVWQKEVGAALGMPGARVAAGGLELEVVGLDPGAAQFDLALLAGLVGDSIAIILKYNADLYAKATVERLAERYQHILRAIVADPQQKVASLPILTQEELHHQLVLWNDTSAPVALAPNLAAAFSAQKERTPDANAVAYDGFSLTYRELDRRAERVARQLVAVGVGPEVIVALAVERSVEMIVALLGIWKAGGAYLPIAPTSPPERVRYLLQDSKAKILLAGEALKKSLTMPDCTVLTIEELLSSPDISEPYPAYHGNGAGTDSLAYVLYTSGSTRISNGVMVTHGSVLNLSLALQKAIYADIGEGPLRVSLNAPLAFDASVKQIVQLLRGHCLIIVPEALRRDPEGLLGFLTTMQIDVIDCTPSLLKPLLRAGLLDRFTTQRSTLKRSALKRSILKHSILKHSTFLVGGEAIDTPLWRTLRSSQGPDFYNVYGPTECTVNTTVCSIERGSRPDGDVPVIGRPLANTQVYILDDQLQLRPTGVAGELAIGGAGVARGYLNRPQLTAERFIENPFTPGTTLYRTGDRARYLEDGSIEFLGRLDNQVKNTRLSRRTGGDRVRAARASRCRRCRGDLPGRCFRRTRHGRLCGTEGQTALHAVRSCAIS